MLTRKPSPADSARAAPSAPPRATVLVTGFEAFGGETVNPSWLAAMALHGKRLLGRKIVAALLPCEFEGSLAMLSRLLKSHRPELVVCVGQAGGRSAISLERVAINVNDARIADNIGAQPVDAPVVEGGPAAYFTGLPIKAMLESLQRAGIAAEVSQTAGTFVCNHVFYGLMHQLATTRALRRTRGGFIHVPYLPEQAGSSCAAAMLLDDMTRGLTIALRAALTNPMDAKSGAGAIN